MSALHSSSIKIPEFESAQFAYVDKDGSGSISREELIKVFCAKPGLSKVAAKSWADEVLREFDVNHDEGLDINEFTAFVNARTARLHSVFCELDVSRTGNLNVSDIRTALTNANVAYLDSDVDALLLKLGAKDCKIDFEQFLEASFTFPRLSKYDYIITHLSLPVPGPGKPPPGTTPAMIVIAGFINGAASRTATAPFDRLRAVLATGRETSLIAAARNMYQTQGLRGFWASNLANVVQVGPENAIAFTLNTVLKDKICSDVLAPTLLERFLLGSVAGATAMSAVYPMYVIQNRLAAAAPRQYQGMVDCARQTAQGGWRACYGGFSVSLIRVMPLKGIMLGGYGAMKDLVKDPETGQISTGRSLACSATAGAVAHIFTYPLHLARTVLQQEVPPGGRQYKGFVDVLRHRMETNGIRGCYAGLPVWLCNRIPAVAIEFAVNERALNAMRNLTRSS